MLQLLLQWLPVYWRPFTFRGQRSGDVQHADSEIRSFQSNVSKTFLTSGILKASSHEALGQELCLILRSSASQEMEMALNNLMLAFKCKHMVTAQ